jgi:sucrose phosphorylase
MLELAGVPGVYVHSLFGSSNCLECVAQTGRPRTINREKFNAAELEQALSGDTREGHILNSYLDLVETRAAHPAFNPQADQKVIRITDNVFALLRADKAGGENILCLSNLSMDDVEVSLDLAGLDLHPRGDALQDLIGGKAYPVADGSSLIHLNACQSLWLLV